MFDNVFLLNAELKGVKNIDKTVKMLFYKQTIDKTFDMSNYRIKAIFGENGCGKTALITAFSLVKDIVLDSRYLNNKQNLLEELINKKEKEFVFSCEYIMSGDENNIVYKYYMKLSHNDTGYFIQNEKLSKKNGNYANNNYRDVFEVDNGKLVYLDAEEKELERCMEKSLNLLMNQSFLRIFISMLDKETKIKDYVYDMFSLLVFFVSLNVYIGDSDKHDTYMLYSEIEKKIISNNSIESRYISDMLNVITSASGDKVGIELFDSYKMKIKRMEQFIKLFKSELKSIDILDEKSAEYYNCRLRFNYGSYTVDREFESTGIKKLVSLFDVIEAACHGGIVFIDEFDANINAIYLEKIIEYIIIYGEGQLCFSTHGLEIMDLLKSEKLAIGFLTENREIINWTAKGNNSPSNYYKKGYIEGIPYNIDSVDLLNIFMENNE